MVAQLDWQSINLNKMLDYVGVIFVKWCMTACRNHSNKTLKLLIKLYSIKGYVCLVLLEYLNANLVLLTITELNY